MAKRFLVLAVTVSKVTRPLRSIGRRAAHSVLARALAEGREMIVLTRQEIERLTATDELVRLLKRKRAQLAVSGTIYEQ